MASHARRPGKEVVTDTDPPLLPVNMKVGMGSSSSPSQSPGRGCLQGTSQVFISFRGEDVRNNFHSHLSRALNQDGICSYRDNEDLNRGDEIDPSLMKAIDDSSIAIIIFSSNYASSSWCLNELAKIMDNKKQGKLKVKPVFYKVDPSEVRSPKDRYAQDLAFHEGKFGKDSEKVKRWREALSEASYLAGWHLDDKSNEAEVIQKIVKDLNFELDRPQLPVAEHPVGTEARVEEIKELMNVDSDKVCFVGLWGMGGVGKTTLAKATYNAIAGKFDEYVFLHNVRDESVNPSVGLAKLQEKLLSQVLRRIDVTVSSVDAGINLIKDKLSRKKVLLVLDDVIKSEQLNALAGGLDWFGRGSRILITTRDNSFLKAHDIHRVYHVKELQPPDACRLFLLHVLSGREEHNIRMDILGGCLKYAKCLPLALVVLGSLVRNRSQDHWIATLRSLEESSDNGIDKVLRVSIDGLDRKAREVFLDIACFFSGWHEKRVESILNSLGYQASLEIQKLCERSLVTMSWIGNEWVGMHDLLQLMGRKIVKEEHPDQPGRHSRLWDYDDVLDVLTSDTVSEDVTRIVLRPPLKKEMDIDPDAFRNVKNLRLLILDNVIYDGDPISLPRGLCWIDLSLYQSSTLQFRRQKEQFRKLKHVCFIECNGLTTIPDLSFCPSLEVVYICLCENLIEVDDSIGCHEKLAHLTICECSNLVKLPDKLRCRSLKSMRLQKCSKLEKLPEFVDSLKSMLKLEIESCKIAELHASVENLAGLENLFLTDCPNLVTIPCSIYRLKFLDWLDIRGCSGLEKFPRCTEASTSLDGVGGLPSLLKLNLSRCNLSEVDFLRDVNCFHFLRELWLGENHNLEKVPSLSHLDELVELDVQDCRRLEIVMGIPISLKVLIARGCTPLRGIRGLTSSRATRLSRMDLHGCLLLKEGIDVSNLLLEEFLQRNSEWMDDDGVNIPGQEQSRVMMKENIARTILAPRILPKLAGDNMEELLGDVEEVAAQDIICRFRF